jgi:zinc-ribbon domain
MKCPKCSSEAADTAKFCPRCHTTLSFECPSCGHKQQHGGACDGCGLDFLKYASALMFAKKAQADAARKNTGTRSTLLKHLLLLPVTGGLPLIRHFFRAGRERDS